MKKLKERWGIESGLQFTVILIVFAVTGSTAAYLSKPILAWFGVTKADTSPWLYYLLYIVLILPVYQVLLVSYGFLSGQFKFFWEFEKKMLRGMGLGFLFRGKKNSRD